jgi:hypothetical protein
MTENDLNNIIALAGVLATKRVRRFAYTKGIGAPRESDSGTSKAVKVAAHELKSYLLALKDGAYFVVDDVIDEAGHEGYEVLHGNPFEATGFSQFKSLRFADCVAHIKKRVTKDEPVYRVKLARRHKDPSVKLINLEKV